MKLVRKPKVKKKFRAINSRRSRTGDAKIELNQGDRVRIAESIISDCNLIHQHSREHGSMKQLYQSVLASYVKAWRRRDVELANILYTSEFELDQFIAGDRTFELVGMPTKEKPEYYWSEGSVEPHAGYTSYDWLLDNPDPLRMTIIANPYWQDQPDMLALEAWSKIYDNDVFNMVRDIENERRVHRTAAEPEFKLEDYLPLLKERGLPRDLARIAAYEKEKREREAERERLKQKAIDNG